MSTGHRHRDHRGRDGLHTPTSAQIQSGHCESYQAFFMVAILLIGIPLYIVYEDSLHYAYKFRNGSYLIISETKTTSSLWLS